MFQCIERRLAFCGQHDPQVRALGEWQCVSGLCHNGNVTLPMYCAGRGPYVQKEGLFPVGLIEGDWTYLQLPALWAILLGMAIIHATPALYFRWRARVAVSS